MHHIKCFVDIGANCGQSANSFRSLNGSATIFSFEPNPFCFSILSSARIDKFFPMPFGLSDRDEFADLLTPVIDRLLVTPLSTMDINRFAPGAMLDEWINKNHHDRARAFLRQRLAFGEGDRFNLKPEAVKIDVEGHELSVLRGLERTLWRHRPIIFLETNGAEGVDRFLRSMEYRAYTIVHDDGDSAHIRAFSFGANKLPTNLIYIHLAQSQDFSWMYPGLIK
ncbi:hypothetical protein C0V82_26455 (plasmid) [Niveispirillum cyanobacteriorum]|uniref:Methyltransferase FkbM domain-containing protein n=2 Tax=Niveispirillum cyanobacteriorum TaxID=1612173 RepID=A0A2K9NLM3_9PROT|nr:hypothetical protein C0V82_26455 [Niveispirillum cyanobacteriorum]